VKRLHEVMCSTISDEAIVDKCTNNEDLCHSSGLGSTSLLFDARAASGATAACNWLKNRRDDVWRTRTTQGLSGSVMASKIGSTLSR
jgi:hypothetical protein